MPADPPDRVDRDRGDRLLVDAMCGKLATYLRMCGYDAAYALDSSVAALSDDGTPADGDPGDRVPADAETRDGEPTDEDLLALSRREDRILVTRDRELAARAEDTIALEASEVLDQLRELAAAGLSIGLPAEPVRCSRCNGGLERLSGDAATPAYAPPPDARPVWRCPDCGQCYWRGSHWDDVAARLSGV